MKKRDLTTKELALYLNTDVAEIRKIRSASPENSSIDTTTQKSAGSELEEDASAIYCYTRTDGKQHCIEHAGEKYCTLQRHCKYQRNNGNKAKFCKYKRR